MRDFLHTRYIQNSASTSTAKKQLQKLFVSSQQDACADKWLLQDKFPTPAAAFENVKAAVMLELKTDSFPRFENID